MGLYEIHLNPGEFQPKLSVLKTIKYTKNFNNPSDVVDLCGQLWNVENCIRECVLLIATRNATIVGAFLLSCGGLDFAVVDPRVLFTALCVCGASSFVLVHNHPSGNLRPSSADNAICDRISKCAEILGYTFLDFIIVSNVGSFSYHSEGLL